MISQSAFKLCKVPIAGLVAALRHLTFSENLDPLAARSMPVQRILFVKFASKAQPFWPIPQFCVRIEMVGRENVYFVVFEDNRFILDAMEIIPWKCDNDRDESVFELVLCLRAVLQSKSARRRSLIWIF